MFRVCRPTVLVLLVTVAVALAGGLAIGVTAASGHSGALPPTVMTGPVTAI